MWGLHGSPVQCACKQVRQPHAPCPQNEQYVQDRKDRNRTGPRDNKNWQQGIWGMGRTEWVLVDQDLRPALLQAYTGWESMAVTPAMDARLKMAPSCSNSICCREQPKSLCWDPANSLELSS